MTNNKANKLVGEILTTVACVGALINKVSSIVDAVKMQVKTNYLFIIYKKARYYKRTFRMQNFKKVKTQENNPPSLKCTCGKGFEERV